MIKIIVPHTREEFKEYYDLRYKVLREPWGLAKGTEKDDYEPISRHFMAVNEETHKVVGGVKLYEKEPGVGCFSHLAVAPSEQGKGVGKQLLDFIEEEAKQQGYRVLGTQARLNTTGYFEKAGYKMKGLPSHFFGTTQLVWMEKTI
jgi:N-acetylglutamate synthase-like GNAT family acetyltransferase